jgi:hypothetical protein
VVVVVVLSRLPRQARLLPALVPFMAFCSDMLARLSATLCRLNRSSGGIVSIIMRRALAVLFEVCVVAIRSSSTA